MDLMDVFVKIGADTSGLESGLNESKSAVSGFAAGIGNVAKAGIGAVAAIGGAVAGSSAAFVSAAGDVAAYGDNIDKMSQKMGISAEGYQEWEAVMQHSGTSMETMKASMKTLANAVEKGNDSFTRIGISIDDLGKMSNEEIFNATIAGLQNVENETERTYLAGQLLGKGATELGALLNTSAADTQAMKDRVHELGGVMSDDAVKAAAQYQDSLQDMTTAFDGLKRGLVSEFLPSITTVMDGLTNLFSGDSKGLGQIKEGIKEFVGNLTTAIPEVLSTGAEIISALIEAVTENAPQLISAGVNAIKLLAQGIIENSGTIIDAFSELLNMALEGLENFDWAGEAQKLVDWLTTALDNDGATGMLETGLNIIMALINGMIEALPALVSGAAEILTAIGEGIKNGLPTLAEKAMEILTGFSEGLGDNLSTLIDAGLDMLMSIADGLIAALPILIQNIPTIITNIVKALVDNAPKLVEGGGILIAKLVVGIVQAIPALIAAIPQLLSAILTAWKNLNFLEMGKHLITGIIKGLTSFAPQFVAKVKETAQKAVTTFKNIDWKELGINLIKTIVKGIISLVTLVPKNLVDVGKKAIDAFKKVDWLSLGKNIIDGVVKGVGDTASKLIDAMVNLAKNAWSAVKKFFGIESPSKLMRDTIGVNIGKGMALGIEASASDVQDAMSDLTDIVETPDVNATVDINRIGNGFQNSDSVLAAMESEQSESRNLTVILELDKTQLAKAVYELNNNETQRVGMKLAGGFA